MVVATEGTPEGLLQGISERPNKTSIFFKDEISGFFDSINRRDYLAGLPEMLTALYDVPPIFKRTLRRETIRVESPAFVLFGGGVKDRVFESLSDNMVISGFLPRFLVVCGDTDMTKLRRTGPPQQHSVAKKAAIIQKIADMYETYASPVTVKIGGETAELDAKIEAYLTPEAWDLYGSMEERMDIVAAESTIADLALPTFGRLSKSILKMAVVLACIRQYPDAQQRVKVDVEDVINAAWYAQKWGKFSIELATSAGKKVNERFLDKILNTIKSNPGILRSTVMQHHHLMKPETDIILNTLEERSRIRKEPAGRGWKYWVI